jgi:VanZ family protein
LFIFIQSSFPSPISGPDIPFFDKYLHVIAYAILGVLFMRAYRTVWLGNNNTKVILFSILSTGLYGISDEIHQHFVPGRDADVIDAVINFIGAAGGVFFYRYVTKKSSLASQ